MSRRSAYAREPSMAIAAMPMTIVSIGVISTRLKRIVTCSCTLPSAGFTALHDPAATALFSPPGAFGGGEVSTVAGGFGSVMYTQAVLAGGVVVVTGPCGHGAATGAP